MTDEEIRKYINDRPTIEGIVEEMKTWWSNEGSDAIVQECFDKILELTDNIGENIKRVYNDDLYESWMFFDEGETE